MKKFFSIVLALTMALSLVACAQNQGSGSTSELPAISSTVTPVEKPSYKIVANSTGNPGTAEPTALETFKAEIEAATDGRITVEVYTSGTLFASDAEMTALASGELDMCLTSFDWFAEAGSPWASMYNCPYMFQSYDDAYAFMTSDAGQAAFDKISEEVGVKVLAPAYIGTRQLIMREAVDVKTTADLNGVLLRVPTTASYVAMADAMGAVATPMALDEVYLALSTGTIDAIEVPMSVMKSRAFYEVCETLVLTNHLVNLKTLVMNDDLWNSFDSEDQALIIAAAEKAGLACDNFVLDDEKTLLSFFEDQGMTVVNPDLDEFQRTVLAGILENKEISGDWDMDIYNSIAG